MYITAPESRIDLRVGGSYLFCMRSSDGKKLLEHSGIPEGKDSNDARQGWEESLDKLQEAVRKRSR
ncbi:MAG: hypothetical protein WCV62_06820 [Candidatus Peribacteraceae bacterium]|jgi:hypothetical protein